MRVKEKAKAVLITSTTAFQILQWGPSPALSEREEEQPEGL